MKQTIRFKGLSLNRDEQSVEPGELSLCGNVELHDGALRPSVLSGTDLADGKAFNGSITRQTGGSTTTISVIPTLKYVHVGNGYTNYISVYEYDYIYNEEERTDSYIFWTNEESTRHSGLSWDVTEIACLERTKIRSIKSVGNSLCVLADDGLHYIKWEKNSGTWSYNYLGQKPPFLQLQFNLHYTESDQEKNTEVYKLLFEGTLYDSTHDAITWPDSNIEFRSELSATITEQVMARVNERIDEGTRKGLFYAPFFVRYCYRLYDGTSLIMHSPPVLMMPNLPRAVLTAIYGAAFRDGDWQLYNFPGELTFSVFLIFSSLQMKLLNDSALTELKSKWGDIVKSVDIFVSPQFSRIDTSRQIEHVVENYSDPNMAIYDGRLDGITFTSGQNVLHKNFGEAFAYTYRTGSENSKNTVGFELQEYPIGDFHGRIRNNSSFFLLTSYNIKDIGQNEFSNFKTLDYDGSKVNNITVQEQMTDDYKTHNELLPVSQEKGGLYVYNHRLNVYGISERLFKGFSPDVAFPYVDENNNVTVAVSSMYVFVDTNSGRRKLKVFEGSKNTLAWLVDSGYYFYPDDRADLLSYAYTPTGQQSAQTKYRRMDASLTLNGSLSFVPKIVSDLDASGVEDRIVPLSNKIYTSRADNPFYFPNLPGESGINSVGSGEIISIAAVTRALSQGQVGDHDLIALCTDGIWVCEVSKQGTYSSMHNEAREVCVNRDSVCQLDQSVIFASGRSLLRFVEQDPISISDILDGPIPVFTGTGALLPGLATLINDSDISRLLGFSTRAIDFFTNGSVLYDYTGHRLIVFPADTSNESVALVFSIRDKAWSTMNIPAVMAALAGYPSAYVQLGDGSVRHLDTPYDYNEMNGQQPVTHKGVIITRTLTFSDTMDVLRGFRQMSDLATMPQLFFYGSNNQRTWQLIGQTTQEYYNYLPGHPFRFFRIAIYFSSIKTSEEYQELILEVVNKYAKL